MRYFFFAISAIVVVCSCSSRRTITNATQKDSISIRHYTTQADSMSIFTYSDVSVKEIGNILLIEEVEIYDTSKIDSLGNAPIKEKRKRTLGGSRVRTEKGTTTMIMDSVSIAQDTTTIDIQHDGVEEFTEEETKVYPTPLEKAKTAALWIVVGMLLMFGAITIKKIML